MDDSDRTREQLIDELRSMRAHLRELRARRERRIEGEAGVAGWGPILGFGRPATNGQDQGS